MSSFSGTSYHTCVSCRIYKLHINKRFLKYELYLMIISNFVRSLAFLSFPSLSFFLFFSYYNSIYTRTYSIRRHQISPYQNERCPHRYICTEEEEEGRVGVFLSFVRRRRRRISSWREEKKLDASLHVEEKVLLLYSCFRFVSDSSELVVFTSCIRTYT